MSDRHQISIEKFGKQVDALSDALAELGRTEDLKHLLLVIRRPGWTTPAEFAFALGIVDSISAHVNALAQLRNVLVKSSELVGGK
jgi:hypothetical protein